MLDGGDRGRLDGPPKTMRPSAHTAPPAPRPAAASSTEFGHSAGSEAHAGPHRHETDNAPPPGESTLRAGTDSGPGSGTGEFDMNRPTIIAGLYILSVFFGFTALIGAVLAYISRGEQRAEWETSHYAYLIRTFWIGFIGIAVSAVLMVAFIGILLLPCVIGLVIVRSVMSINNAQKHLPMPKPDSWLI